MKAPNTGQTQYRATTTEVQADNESITFSVSSDLPYKRQFGFEVLDHSKEAVDLSRLADGAAVLVDHAGDQVGVVQRAWLEGNRLYCSVKFSKSQRGQEIEQDVRDGIRRNVSIGYMVNQWDDAKTRTQQDGIPVYRAVNWTPYEVSIVAVPADHSVGVGRSMKVGFRRSEDEPILVYDENNEAVQAILPDGTVVTDPTELANVVASVSAAEVVEEVVEEAVEPVASEEPAVEMESTEDALEASEVPAEMATMVETLQEQVQALASTLETISNELITDTVAEEPTSNDEEAATDAQGEETPSSRRANIPLMESNTMKNNLDTISNPNIKLTEREQKEYSLSRALLQAADGKRSGFEFEISDEIAKKTGKDTNGFWMPTSVRSYDIGTSNAAGALTLTQGGEFVDFLRNKATVAGLGATVMTLSAKTALPRANSDLSAQWIAEDGSGANLDTQTFDQVVFSPKKLATYTGVTREALAVATYDVENIIRNNIYASFATAFDKAAIQGAGGNEPTGILNISGLVSGSNSGSALTFAGAVDLYRLVAEGNADMGALAYLSTVAVKTKAMTTIKAGSNTDFIVDNSEKIGLYNCVHSNNVPNLAGGGVLIFGDWSSLVLAEFGAIEIVVDPYTSKHKGIVEVGATMLGDVQVKTPRSFAIQKGLV